MSFGKCVVRVELRITPPAESVPTDAHCCIPSSSLIPCVGVSCVTRETPYTINALPMITPPDTTIKKIQRAECLKNEDNC